MVRAFLMFLVFVCAASQGAADDNPQIKYPSPDGRFALRITKTDAEEYSARKVDLIEKSSGKVLVPLGDAYYNHLSETVLMWSADSKRAAYATRGDKEGDTSVYFWNGSAFDEIPLPDNLPGPDIKFRKGAGANVKNYGGAVAPVRWLKTGQLELSSDLMMLSRVDGRSYTGVLNILISFGPQHHATAQAIGKTKTRVDD